MGYFKNELIEKSNEFAKLNPTRNDKVEALAREYCDICEEAYRLGQKLAELNYVMDDNDGEDLRDDIISYANEELDFDIVDAWDNLERFNDLDFLW